MRPLAWRCQPHQLTRMNEKIQRIRELLAEVEAERGAEDSSTAIKAFSGLELPDIINDFVDFLMPLLKPYEASLYIYMLRHGIIEHGSQLVRVSVRGLQNGVVRSAYADTTKGLRADAVSGERELGSSALSYGTVQSTLSALEKIGAIRKEGEPTREGTLYRLLLPEEIPACQSARKLATADKAPLSANELDADFYNVRENRLKVFERDAYKCQYCKKQLTRFTATLDHVQAVSAGGDNSFDNLLTACRSCNSRKQSRLMSDFLADSEQS